MPTPFVRDILAAAALSATAFAAQASFTIGLNFSGLTVAQESYFTAAKSFWETTLTGYGNGINLSGFTINASGSAIDGVGGILGQAGPTSGVVQAGYTLTTGGVMEFDTADIDVLITKGSFTDVIKHEMAHVIGFGTWWTNNNVYVDGTGHYTGANALAQFRTEFNQPGASFVPVEMGGGAGTADAHWNEVDGGSVNTGIADAQGRDMRYELMTGWLNSPSYVSNTTVASFQDIGYTVNLSAVPEPGIPALWLVGLPLLAGVVARPRRRAPS
jgi:hypothetical protein